MSELTKAKHYENLADEYAEQSHGAATDELADALSALSEACRLYSAAISAALDAAPARDAEIATANLKGSL